MSNSSPHATAEKARLERANRGEENWRRWGPYLSERQWGTVREDYSVQGAAWNYLPHDHARSRAYRWGEDGIVGISDDQSRLCLALARWNGRDPILKERLFGLTNGEGNHGEDVKELYYYLDATPTHSVSGLAGSVAAASTLLLAGGCSTGWIPLTVPVVAGIVIVGGVAWMVAAWAFGSIREFPGETSGGVNGLAAVIAQLDWLRTDARLRRLIATRILLLSTALAPRFTSRLAATANPAVWARWDFSCWQPQQRACRAPLCGDAWQIVRAEGC